MAASQINTTDSVTGGPVAIDSELVAGKHHPMHGVRDGMDEALGGKPDTPATDDAGTFSLIALFKRLLGKLPSTLGPKTAANSLSVTLSTDDDALLGSLTEVAPANDTALSGINGRLQRVAQRITSLIALLPSALGTTTAANSLPVTLATDGTFATLSGAVTEAAPATDIASSGLNGRLQRVAQRITDLIAAVGGFLTVRGYAFDKLATPAVTAGAYSAGDIVGGLLTFAAARANDELVVITGAQVISKAAVIPAYTLVLFSADPIGTTKTDNAPYSLAAADAFKVIGTVTFGTSWYDHGTPNSIRSDGLNIVAAPDPGTKNIYGLLIDATGATLASTGDIQVRLRGVGA